jgi:hypothetical protein
MAAHRASKPATDPLATAQAEIEQRLADGDPSVRRWLEGLLPSRQELPEPLKVDEFDYSRVPDQSFRQWLMVSEGLITNHFGTSFLHLLEDGARLHSAKLSLAPDLYCDWVTQACGLTPVQANSFITAAADAQDMEDLPEPWRLFDLLRTAALASRGDGNNCPTVDVEPVPSPLAELQPAVPSR